jgi:hypothetical protein
LRDRSWKKNQKDKACQNTQTPDAFQMGAKCEIWHSSC